MKFRVIPFTVLVLIGAAFAAAQNVTPSPAAAAQGDVAARTKSLNDLFDEIWQDELSHSPLMASSLGDKRYDAQLPDESAGAYNDGLARDAQYLGRLAAIDPAGMPEQETLSRDLMIEELTRAQEASQFKPWEMPVTAFSGLPVTLPRLAARMQFASAEDYDNYTKRLNGAPTAFHQITDDIMIGIADKRVPPKSTLEALLKQINLMLAMKPEESPFAAPLGEFPASIGAADQANLRQEVLTAITKQVYPAYQRFAKFLQAVYIPAARADDGAWALPDGDAYYAFEVKQHTTMDLTVAQIHQFGETWVAQDEADELALAKKLGYPTPAALRTAMAADAKLHPTSAAQLVGAYRTALTQASAKLPEFFTSAPGMAVRVEAMPAWMERDYGAALFEPGAQGGTLYVNTSDLAHRSLADAEWTVQERVVPGEGFQTFVQREQTGLPAFRRWLEIPAFTEGWGMYAQQLGQDAGLYQDPYAEAARLERDEEESIALVVDTGIHADHWPRQQAIDYYHAHSGLSDAEIGTAVDRIIAEPGRALAPKAGELEMLGFRGAAQTSPCFNLRAFHQELTGAGALPLDMLSDRMAAWIESGSAKPCPGQ